MAASRDCHTSSLYNAEISGIGATGANLLTCACSGTAAYPRCSSAPVSASPSESFSPYYSSSDAHGPHSSVSDSVLAGRGKSVTT
jgi:hypothetical protein